MAELRIERCVDHNFAVPCDSLDNKNNNPDLHGKYEAVSDNAREDNNDEKTEGRQIKDKSSHLNRQQVLISPQSQKKKAWNVQQKKLQKSLRFQPQAKREFLLGGNITDPLNLKSLSDEEVNRLMNERTPQSSPIQLPSYRQQVEMITPPNMKDPLNLRSKQGIANFAIKKHRHPNKGKSCEEKDKDISTASEKPDSVFEPLSVQIEPVTSDVNVSCISTISIGESSTVVSSTSPAIPLYNKTRKRTRTISECAADVCNSTIDSSKCDNTSSPKKLRVNSNLSLQSRSTSVEVKRSNKNKKFVYGNYNRYYGYRNPGHEEDERLKFFQRDWFFGKDVLDIGCNTGLVTLTIARDFLPRRMVGIDIDRHLIDVAKKNIRYYLSNLKSETRVNNYPLSVPMSHGPVEVVPISTEIITHGQSGTFPENVFFFKGNYVPDNEELVELQREEFDVILALSVTKWVHLNWGDDGLKRMFRRVYKQLRPGGLFIIEPQPFSSYKKKKNLTDTIRRNYDLICLKPEQFTNYLRSSEVGFTFHYTLAMPHNKSKGFRRPIQVFVKARPGEEPQNLPWMITPLMDIGLRHLSPHSAGEGNKDDRVAAVRFAIGSAAVTPCSSCHSYDPSCSLCQRSAETSPTCSTPTSTCC